MSNSRVPAQTFEFRHSLDIQVRFNDIDIFGHVNNAIAMQYFDLAKLDYFHFCMGHDFSLRDLAMVIVNINCDFFSPSKMTEPLAVISGASHLGEKSLTLEQRLINKETGEVKAIARTVMSGFDIKTGSSVVIPDRQREALLRNNPHLVQAR